MKPRRQRDRHDSGTRTCPSHKKIIDYCISAPTIAVAYRKVALLLVLLCIVVVAHLVGVVGARIVEDAGGRHFWGLK